ncbi:hypothetical protein SERLA73DRAFT_59745 [Serpula lacrymans var. lacrymans S7.3]|uniref:N-terminal of MaoC-like dehydratase domain-containing protein n=1 Tax=Serpula lacrymans var. lacrymans (strain S7.3) TaxID=936435 RepID=F8Q5S8_SERL3|nr:hypothetical protein SERLA73DRAFT_59745 [Serpula lacrymans var. lacrymans S7.3]
MTLLFPRLIHGRRFVSTSALHVEGLDKWIASKKQLVLHDTLRAEHLSDLYITLPTRDGGQGRPYQPPRDGTQLSFGHHLVFFHPRNPESTLRADGTDTDFCPPEPFTRRMWAGGSMIWNRNSPLLVGSKATAVSTLEKIEKKGFEKNTPMVFVKQKIEITIEGSNEPSVVEERSHVYLTSGGNKRLAREGANFSFHFTPSLTTLFRFSALTFNGHYIHLDKDYAQKTEGYPERLVHGPLTALMLLEAVVFQKPGLKIKSFDYRARNPVIVSRPVIINGTWMDESRVELWSTDDNGVVGMTGSVTYSR